MKPFESNCMKRTVIITLGVIGITLLSGCSMQNQTSDQTKSTEDTHFETTLPVEENKEKEDETYVDLESKNAGMLVFMGGGLTEDEILKKKQQILDEYLGNEELPFYDCSGPELFCIIPHYVDSTIIVKKVELSDKGELEEKETIVNSDKPILIQCNESDLYPNVNITINHKEESTSFSPYISLKDGSVIAADNIEVIDLTKE